MFWWDLHLGFSARSAQFASKTCPSLRIENPPFTADFFVNPTEHKECERASINYVSGIGKVKSQSSAAFNYFRYLSKKPITNFKFSAVSNWLPPWPAPSSET
jgi:hypothetical protein